VISNKATAQLISALMLDFGRRLDASVLSVQETCTPEEFRAYRRAVGKVMGDMLLEVLNPLYVTHPELKPRELK
jgi:hypothetical protein